MRHPVLLRALVARARVERHEHRQRARARQRDAVDRQPVAGTVVVLTFAIANNPRTFSPRAPEPQSAARWLHYASAGPCHALARQPLTAVLMLLLPVLLLVGMWLGGHPEDLPGFLRSAFVAEPRRRSVVDEAIERIANDYYRPITARASSTTPRSAGVVASLGDRFSHYLSPAEFREFTAPPHFTGIGVAVATQVAPIMGC